MRTALLVALALAAASCDDTPVVDFKPASVVDTLRILGVRAEPPELAPGQSTFLTALVADPKEGRRPVGMVWLLCDPAPDDSPGNVCASQDTLRNLDVENLPEGVRVVPFLAANYTAPWNALESLEPDSIERRRGLSATIMLVVFEGESLADLQDPNLQKAVAIKRVRIADRTSTPANVNPDIADVTLAGTSIDRINTPGAPAGSTVELAATADPASAQEFIRVMPDGSELKQTEQVVFSWFTTDGRFEEGLEYASRTQDGKPIRLVLPTKEEARRSYVEFFVVLRDARGGTDWTRRLVRLE